MYRTFEVLLEDALDAAIMCGDLGLAERPACRLEPVANPFHGDATCRVAMTIARRLGRPAIDIARVLVGHVTDERGWIDRVEAAGPGFVNVRASIAFWRRALAERVHGEVALPATQGRALVVAVAGPDGAIAPRVEFLRAALGRLLGAAGFDVALEALTIPELADREDAAALKRTVVLHAVDEAGVSRRAKVAVAQAGGRPGWVVAVPVAPLAVRARGRVLDAGVARHLLADPSACLMIARTPAATAAVVDVERLARDRIDNPWVSVHYARARIARLASQPADAGDDERLGEAERDCLQGIGGHADVVVLAARRLEVDAVVAHMIGLAAAFHRYYNRGRFLESDPRLVRARASLARGIGSVLEASLDLVGATGAGQG